MSKRCNKQNRVSALIKKKPSKCIYEKQGIKKNPQKRELLGIQATFNTSMRLYRKQEGLVNEKYWNSKKVR